MAPSWSTPLSLAAGALARRDEAVGVAGSSRGCALSLVPAPTPFVNPSTAELRALLTSVQTLAVVGCSPHDYRTSHQVAATMQRYGFRIVPVHPSGEVILGARAYTDLSLVPCEEGIDVVTVFRRPEALVEAAKQAVRLRARALWLQLGIYDEEAAAIAAAGGLQCVMDACISVTYHLVV